MRDRDREPEERWADTNPPTETKCEPGPLSPGNVGPARPRVTYG